MLTLIQIGMNTNDMAATLQLHSEAFGFVNSGGQGLWGAVAKVQGLDENARAIMWCLLGRQNFMQLEFFQHSHPAQRPLRADWRPNDHGWVRYGVAVPDFDASMAVLAKYGIPMLGATMISNGLRRAAFRDPQVGCVIEVMEDGAPITGDFAETSGQGPALVYTAASVSDIDAARVHYEKVLGLDITPLEDLHAPEHEALWGLAGAARTGFLARAGDMRLEIVQYQNPQGRPKPADYRSSDQGIVNVAFGSRERAEAAAAVERLQAAGYFLPHVLSDENIIAAYVTTPERETEIVCVPPGYDAALGFVAAAPFLGSMK